MPSCTANPNRVWSLRRRSTSRRSLSSRKKNRSSSADESSLSNRPYAADCSSLRNCTGTRSTYESGMWSPYRRILYRYTADT